MAASGGDGERFGLGQFVKSQTKYGTATKSIYTNDTFYKYHVQSNETIQGIALKHGVTVEQIKRANNIWTNDSLFLRAFLLIPIDKDSVFNQQQKPCSNGSIPQATTSKAAPGCLEIVTRQDLQNANKTSRSKSLTPLNTKDSSGTKAKHSVGVSFLPPTENVKDFLSKMDCNLTEIKGKVQKLDETSEFPEDLQNPLNLLPKKPSKYRKKSGSLRSIDNEAFDPSTEPELAFRSSWKSQSLETQDKKADNDIFQL